MIHRAPTGPIGYRLANELEGLLLGISADGVVTARELGRLKSWRTANASYAHIKPFSALFFDAQSRCTASIHFDTGMCEDSKIVPTVAVNCLRHARHFQRPLRAARLPGFGAFHVRL